MKLHNFFALREETIGEAQLRSVATCNNLRKYKIPLLM
jgi:hypothetical protein